MLDPTEQIAEGEEQEEDDQEALDDISSSESEDESTAVEKPYGTLLGLFKVDEQGPARKRRKLDSAKAHAERETSDVISSNDAFDQEHEQNGTEFNDLEQRDASDDEDEVDGHMSDDDEDENLEHNGGFLISLFIILL